MEKILEKFMTAALGLSDIFIKFLEINLKYTCIISNVILQETMI